jgi:poly(hydroxyalkanoate) granule-associated protein
MPTKSKVEEAPAEGAKSEAALTEMLRKVLLATLGAAVIAQEEIEALVNKLVERGEIAEKDGKKLVHEMMDKRKSKTQEVEEEVNKNIKDVLERMNIPTKSDIDTLSQKISALSKKIDDLKKTA